MITLEPILSLARQEAARLHHYFVGVEHLFTALTQLEGGLTTAVLEQHGISPRFVRYSIRETVGRYENRRYWPGFPETPRAAVILQMARSYAGEQEEVTERDLLLAILDENDSVVTRILQQMGIDPAALRDTAATWTVPLEAQPPQVRIRGSIELDPEHRQVIEVMFRDYSDVHLVRVMDGGHSGARVLLARPVRVGGQQDAPVIVKLDEREAVLHERRRYDLYVKGRLPAGSAQLVDSPTVPDNIRSGGLKYTFVGHMEEAEPASLREVALSDPAEASELIRLLFEGFGPTWWLQHQSYRFGMWREYEHVLPPALVIEALSVSKPGGHELQPLGSWSRSNEVLPGEIVALNGFAVQKLDLERDVLHLAAGRHPEAINRSGKVEVRGLALEQGMYFRGDMIERLVGRVTGARDDLLLRSLQALEPYFDFRADVIPSLHRDMPDLPMPLRRVGGLLERQISGFISPIHGDLHLGNVLVGRRGDPWLIDFGWAREGHTLFDWGLLETSLLVEVVAQSAAAGWEGTWDVIALLDALNQGDENITRERHPLARALGPVQTIRELAGQCLGTPGRWDEYYAALALLALRAMDWKSAGLAGRRLAFLLAALYAAVVTQHDSLDGTMNDGGKPDFPTQWSQGRG